MELKLFKVLWHKVGGAGEGGRPGKWTGIEVGEAKSQKLGADPNVLLISLSGLSSVTL